MVPLLFLVLAAPRLSYGQTCAPLAEMEPATRSAIEGAARRIFQQAAGGDVAGMRQNSIPAIANDFGGIESAVVGHQANLQAAQPQLRQAYLLEAMGNAPLARAEFFCGVFSGRGHTKDSAAFSLNNLPPGRYAVAIVDAAGSKLPYTLTFILQESGGWKLAGYYVEQRQVGGHDAQWFLQRAREYKAKGQSLNAWLYYLVGWELTSPVPFMSTLEIDRIAEEMQAARPAGLPSRQNPVSLAAGGRNYNLVELTYRDFNGKLYLDARYSADTSPTFGDSNAVLRAVVAKHPELREAFEGVIATGVTSAGQQSPAYLAMKDLK